MISFKRILPASLLLSAFLGFSAPLSAMDLSESIRQEALAMGKRLQFDGEQLTSDELGARLREKEEAECAKITVLSLQWCNLENLPVDLATLLPNLQVLDLLGSRINPESLLYIPASVQLLDLRNNKLERLPEGFADHFRNLRELNLYGNYTLKITPSVLNALANSQIIKVWPDEINKKIQSLCQAKRDKLALFKRNLNINRNLNQKKVELIVEQLREKNYIPHIASSLGGLTDFLKQNLEINGPE